MIIGVFIRNFKLFSQTTFIPLSNGEYFTGLIGDNGVGKTTILQALDVYFNKSEWQCSVWADEKEKSEAFIQPVFLIPRDLIPEDLKKEADTINKYMWELRGKTKPDNDPNGYLKYFGGFISSVPDSEFKKTHIMLSIGTNSYQKAVYNIFDKSIINDADRWYRFINSVFNYIYVPTSPDPVSIFSKLSNKQLLAEVEQMSKEDFDCVSPSLLDTSERLLLTVAVLNRSLPQSTGHLCIAGFDEPESALQISSCYDLFERIYKIVGINSQVILTSHWYGFIPLLTQGLLVNILRQNKKTKFFRFDISRFREDIKIRKRIFKEKYHEELPVDVELKTVNDFIQTVIGSVINEPYYNWLICEGSSEKIYFNYYFEDLIRDGNLRIVPVGGVREVKKIYTYLTTPFSDLRDYIKGRVLLLSDTDTQLLEFETHNIPNLYCYRLVNHHGKSELVHIKANPKSPATEIEDVLNGLVFHKALLYFKKFYPDHLDFVSDEDTPQSASYYSLDLPPSHKDKLTAFFDHHHSIKTQFAYKYIEICKSGNYETPEWINNIKDIFTKEDN